MQPQDTTPAPFRGRNQSGTANSNYRGGLPIITCQTCGNNFESASYDRRRKYCSLACAYASPTRSPKKVSELVCINCGKTFTKMGAVGHRRCCSEECRLENWSKIHKGKPVAWANGHPRGMLGKKHTEESRQQMSAIQRGRKFSEERSRKIIATRLERYGTAGPVNVSNPYSRAKRGRRWDLDNMYFRSSWEANYARYLNWLCMKKQIKNWKYEAKTFRFEGVTRGPYTYLPDFEVELLDGSLEYHEVKGWMDSASRSRLKRMKEFYPDVPLVVVSQEEYRMLNALGPVYSMFWE